MMIEGEIAAILRPIPCVEPASRQAIDLMEKTAPPDQLATSPAPPALARAALQARAYVAGPAHVPEKPAGCAPKQLQPLSPGCVADIHVQSVSFRSLLVRPGSFWPLAGLVPCRAARVFGLRARHRLAALNSCLRTSVPFEVLDFSFVLCCRLTRGEGPQVSPLAGLGVLLSRVQAVLTCFELSDHFPQPCATVLAGRLADCRELWAG